MSQKYSELKDQLENMHRESQLLKSENKSLQKITINLALGTFFSRSMSCC